MESKRTCGLCTTLRNYCLITLKPCFSYPWLHNKLPQTQCFKTAKFIISECMWVRILCVTQQGILFQDQPQATIKVGYSHLKAQLGKAQQLNSFPASVVGMIPFLVGGWTDGLQVPFISGIICQQRLSQHMGLSLRQHDSFPPRPSFPCVL